MPNFPPCKQALLPTLLLFKHNKRTSTPTQPPHKPMKKQSVKTSSISMITTKIFSTAKTLSKPSWQASVWIQTNYQQRIRESAETLETYLETWRFSMLTQPRSQLARKEFHVTPLLPQRIWWWWKIKRRTFQITRKTSVRTWKQSNLIPSTSILTSNWSRGTWQMLKPILPTSQQTKKISQKLCWA